MRKHDFGTVQVFLDAGRIDVFFQAKKHEEIKALLKNRFKARWDGVRFCWYVTMKNVRDSHEAVVSAIEQELYAHAPPHWKGVVEKLGDTVCASKRYELKIGAGGLRVMLPGGHPLHWDISKMTGEEHRSDTWELPAKSMKGPDMKKIVTQAVEQDHKVFIDEVEPYAGRTIAGLAVMTPEYADRLGLHPGRVIFANYSFLRIADPQVVNPDVVRRQVRAWPFVVQSREDGRGDNDQYELDEGLGVMLKLAYPEAEKSFVMVRNLMRMPDDKRPPQLDEPHALDKWRFRNAI